MITAKELKAKADSANLSTMQKISPLIPELVETILFKLYKDSEKGYYSRGIFHDLEDFNFITKINDNSSKLEISSKVVESLRINGFTVDESLIVYWK